MQIPMTTKAKTIAYWTTTGLLAAGLLVGGVADLIRLPAWAAVTLHLGYPLYVATILGVWKLLGAIVLLAPRLPRLKEWAYAGVVFTMTGAVASHLAAGDGPGQIFWPVIFVLLAIASWALRPQGRVMGEIFPARPRGIEDAGADLRQTGGELRRLTPAERH